MVDPRAVAEDSLIEEDFLVELKANGLSDNSLLNYCHAVDSLKDLEKSPREMDKSDLVKWSADLLEGYADSTKHLYRTYVKRYFKWLYTGEFNGDRDYPKSVKWISTSMKKKNLPKEILSHKEVKRLADATEMQRDRAMIWVGYESGCRPGELVSMRIRDVDFDEYGAQVMVEGKTGERRIRLVESVPDLKRWLSMHPEKETPHAELWWSREGGAILRSSWYHRIGKIGRRAEIKKHVYPHLLRHSRATHLAAEGLNEAQLREIFGWTRDSNMPSVYVHLSGRDTDGAILELYGIEIRESENQLEMGVKECSFCGCKNSPNAKFCDECNGPLDAMAAKSSNKKVREQDQLTKKVIRKLMDRAPKILEEVLREEEISQEVQRLGESEAKA